MLTLDEKKIRKGRPVGLPYQGSKKKISKKIVEIIKQNFGTDKPIYDIFGGGGAITAECLINGLDVHYNDLDETITEMFKKVISSDREYLKTLIISREEFFKIRDKQEKSVEDNLKLLVNSFGNDRKTYLYSKEFSDLKHNLAIEIIKKHDAFNGYKKTETYKNAYRPFDVGKESKGQVLQQLARLQQLERVQQLGQLKIIEQLHRLQQLSRVQQLGQLQQLQQLEYLRVTNLDYKEFSKVENAILYLDPPYERAKNKGYLIDGFDSQSFYDWAYEMSKKNIVIISSYEISDSRFQCVYEFKKVKSMLAAQGRGDKTEKLFMVK